MPCPQPSDPADVVLAPLALVPPRRVVPAEDVRIAVVGAGSYGRHTSGGIGALSRSGLRLDVVLS